MTPAQISEKAATAPAPRALRAALFTTLVVTLSVASHVLLSRVALPAVTVAATAVAVFALAYPLAGRERGFAAIAGLLIPLELAADTLFTSGQNACYGAAGGPVAGTLRSVGFDVLCGGSAVGTSLPGVAGVPGAGGVSGAAVGSGARTPASVLLAHAGPATAWLLLAAHIAVGLLAAAWLRRGERAAAQLLTAAVAAAFRPLRLAAAADVPYPASPLRLPRTAHRPYIARTRAWLHSLGRRGPPCPACPAVMA